MGPQGRRERSAHPSKTTADEPSSVHLGESCSLAPNKVHPRPRGRRVNYRDPVTVSYRVPAGIGTGCATVVPYVPAVRVIESTAMKAVYEDMRP